jgi:hypothetical protein
LSLIQVSVQNTEDDLDRLRPVDRPDVLQSLPDAIEEVLQGSVPVRLRCEMPLIVVDAPHEDRQLGPQMHGELRRETIPHGMEDR